MAQKNNIKERFYAANTEDNPTVTFVNWLTARNVRGLIWFIRNAPKIRNWLHEQDGMLYLHLAFKSPRSVLLVSYWRDQEALRNSFRSPYHIEMMRYIYANQDDLALGNETFGTPTYTNYLNAEEGYVLSNAEAKVKDFQDPAIKMQPRTAEG